MRRKEIFIVAMLMFALVFAGCGAKTESDVTIIGGADGPTSVFLASKNDKNSYTQIDQETAKLMMDIEDDHVIVDVRRQDEFDEGHIPGAICIPNESIIDTQPEELPDLDQIILVYCRSGRRSKEASQKLFYMGSVLVSHWERYSLTHSFLAVDDGLLTYHACPVDDRMTTQLN